MLLPSVYPAHTSSTVVQACVQVAEPVPPTSKHDVADELEVVPPGQSGVASETLYFA